MTVRTSDLLAWVLTNRRVVRAPIWLYRHGLGRLMGSRMLMLEHVGRRSGEPRYVVLEVVERPGPNTLIIVSGFGKRAQWYRNLHADPMCKVSTGSLNEVPAQARLMSEQESAEALAAYVRKNPQGWEHLREAIEKATGEPVGVLPMVELTLKP